MNEMNTYLPPNIRLINPISRRFTTNRRFTSDDLPTWAERGRTTQAITIQATHTYQIPTQAITTQATTIQATELRIVNFTIQATFSNYLNKITKFIVCSF